VQLRQRHSTHVAGSSLQRQEVAATTPALADHLANDRVENDHRKKDRLPSPKAEKERRAASKTDNDEAKFAPTQHFGFHRNPTVETMRTLADFIVALPILTLRSL